MKTFLHWVLFVAALVATGSPCWALASGKNEPVQLQLKWFHQFQFAGYYAAKEMGFYDQAGLSVRILEGGPDVNVKNEVCEGRSQFGVLGSELAYFRAKGDEVVVLAPVIQHSLRVIIAKPSVHTPHDLNGKRVMLNQGELPEFAAMFLNEGLSLAAVNVIPKDPTAIPKFVRGEISAMNGSMANQPFLLDRKGVPYTIIKPVSYGIDFYGDTLFTTSEMAARNTHMVARFREASLKGWRFAFQNPDAVVDLILKQYSPKKSREHLMFEQECLRGLIHPDLVEIGHNNPRRWDHILATYIRLNMIEPVTFKGFFFDDYLNAVPFWKRHALWLITAIVLVVLLTASWNMNLHMRIRRMMGELLKGRESLRVTLEQVRRSEQNLRSYMENAPYGIFILDDNGIVLEVNPAICRVSGLASDRLLGEHFNTLTQDLQKKDLRAGRFHGTCRLVREDGDERICELDLVRLSEERVLGFIHDVTRQKRLEEERKAAENQLRQASKMEAVGNIAGGIAHDFNNILGIIIGNVELGVEEVPPGHPVLDYLEEIRVAGFRASEVVRQLLSFSRKSEQNRQVIHLGPLIREAVSLLRASIPSSAEIKVHIDDAAGPILADPTQIHQVLINLCTNASHAMEGGTIDIRLDEIWLSPTGIQRGDGLSPGRYTRLCINDTGHGIPPEVLPRIFEPYFTTKQAGKGTGMGLAVVHGIVKSCGGGIAVETSEESGTSFKLLFPVSTGETEQAEPPPEAVPRGTGQILLVDDEQALLDIGKKLLETLGYKVSAFVSPGDALAAFEKSPREIDLVITDMTMPGMTGDALVKKLLSIRADLPVVLCSGYTDKLPRLRALDNGQILYVEKPFKKEVLARAVARSLASWKIAVAK